MRAGGADAGSQVAAAEESADARPLLLAPAWRFVTGIASVLNLSEENIKTLMRHTTRPLSSL